MRKRLSAIVAALLIAMTGSALAQVATTGTITVVIADKDGGRLPGVTVTAEAPDSITKRTAVTDTTGTATLEALQPSSQYKVTASLQGFNDLTPTSTAAPAFRRRRSRPAAGPACSSTSRRATSMA